MATKEKSLYDRLGRQTRYHGRFQDDFTARVASADRQINRFFANTDVPASKA